MEIEACQIAFQQYSIFILKVRDGLLWKKAQLWLYYKDKISIFLRCLRATKEKYMVLHIACLQEMFPLLPWTTITMLNSWLSALFHYQMLTRPILVLNNYLETMDSEFKGQLFPIHELLFIKPLNKELINMLSCMVKLLVSVETFKCTSYSV